MLLAIDVGNSNTEFGVFAGRQLKSTWKCETDKLKDVSSARSELSSVLTALKMRPTEVLQIGVSSVVPQLASVFETVSKDQFHKLPLVVHPGLDLGIRILYKIHETLGTDRICSAVAGFSKYGGPLIIVDLGTATTFNVIDTSGAFLGGSITLGLKSTSDALHDRAARLPSVSLELPKTVIAKDTNSAIQSGVMFGCVDAIDGMAGRIQSELGATAKIIATGGLCKVVAPASKTISACEPFLVLEGIRIICERNAA